MISKNKIAILAAGAVTAAGGVAVATAATGTPDGSTTSGNGPSLGSPRALDGDVSQNFAAFRSGAQAPADAALVEAAERQAKADRSLGEPVIDFARAVPVPLDGAGSQRAWIAPADGGKVCTVTASDNGVGASCQTVGEIQQGYGLTVSGSAPKGQALVISVVADGQKLATLTGPDGAVRPLGAGDAANPNAAGAVVATDQKVAFGKRFIDLAKLPVGR